MTYGEEGRCAPRCIVDGIREEGCVCVYRHIVNAIRNHGRGERQGSRLPVIELGEGVHLVADGHLRASVKQTPLYRVI